MPEIISRAEAKAKGLKRYFTGKPCKHGHVSERYIGGKFCIQCEKVRDNNESTNKRKKSYQKEYQEKNREKLRAAAKAQREANREEVRESARACYWKRRAGKLLSSIDGAFRTLSERGAIMDEREAIEIFKAQDSAFDFMELD